MLEGQADVVYELNKRTMNAGDYPSACLFAQTYLAKNAEKLGKAVLLIVNSGTRCPVVVVRARSSSV
jgi:hypothetical protein